MTVVEWNSCEDPTPANSGICRPSPAEAIERMSRERPYGTRSYSIADSGLWWDGPDECPDQQPAEAFGVP